MTIQIQRVPVLRFPGFDGEWAVTEFNECFIPFSKIALVEEQYPLFSLTIEKGVTPKTDRYERAFLVGDENNAYKVVRKDYFVLNPMNLRFGALARHRDELEVAVSKYYDVFFCKENYSPEYFSNYLLTNRMVIFYNRMATGTLEEKKRVHFSEFIKFKKPIPEFTEQQKIASFLSSIDTKIEQLSKKKAKLEKYKKGMMQKLFSKEIRFKDEEGKDYPEWEEKKLGDIATFNRGKGISKSDIDETGENKCIRYGELYTAYEEVIYEVISRTHIQKCKSFLSKANDVLMPTSDVTPNGLATASALDEKDIILGGDILIIRTQAINNRYFCYYISAHKNDVIRLVSGVTVYHIYGSDMATLKLNIPSLPEQQKIADFLSSIDDKIERVGEELEKAKTFKKGLLQQMFV